MLGIAISAVLFMGLVLPAHTQIEKSDLYIGLLLDFKATNAERDLALLQEETHKVLGVDKSVRFLPEHLRFAADYEDYLSLANDPAVDLIIAAGPATAAMLAAQGNLPKPTIAVGILDVELQQMPLVEPGVSGVQNLATAYFDILLAKTGGRIQIELNQSGRASIEAIVAAAQQRFRPILLTTCTTTLGLIPLYLGGGLMWEPMAVAIMVGLLFATVITLLFVPVLYKILFAVKN